MKTFAIIMAALLTINLCACSQGNKTKEDKDMGTIYDYTALSNKGQEVNFADYKGKVLLIVNTATGCGFTPQYKGLEALYRKYKEQGFVVLDFPCNQFLGQAPGSDTEINSFCTLKYDTTFPRYKKIAVNGKEACPLYVYLKERQKGKLGSNIKWNFTKFLIDKEGNVVERFAPTVKPEDIDEKIQKLL